MTNSAQALVFKSYKDLVADTYKLIEKLDFYPSAIVGVPRSGMIPATIIAQHFHVPMRPYVASERMLRYLNPHETNDVLVIDDSVIKGKAISLYSGRKACLYTRTDTPKNVVDYSVETTIPERVFEWNLWSSWILERSMCDIDGVLCHDKAENALSAKPLYRPMRKIGALCSSRLDCKDRFSTMEWLAHNHIDCDRLILNPSDSVETRRAERNHAFYKAKAYAESEMILFIENEEWQAREIHRVTRKPVLWTGDPSRGIGMEMLQ